MAELLSSGKSQAERVVARGDSPWRGGDGQRVLLVKTASLSRTKSTLAALHSRFPITRIALLTEEREYEPFLGHPDVAEVLFYVNLRSLPRLWRRIRCDLIVGIEPDDPSYDKLLFFCCLFRGGTLLVCYPSGEGMRWERGRGRLLAQLVGWYAGVALLGAGRWRWLGKLASLALFPLTLGYLLLSVSWILVRRWWRLRRRRATQPRAEGVLGMVAGLGESTVEYVACDLCGSTDTKPMPAYYLFQGHRLDLVKCRWCQLVYVNPRPTEKVLAALYSSEYFECDWSCGAAGESYIGHREQLLADYRQRIQRVKGIQPSGRLLDVGCAGGYLLLAARETGYEVQGVEIAIGMVEYGRNVLGLDIHHGDLVSAGFPAGYFDVVYLGDLIEHLPHPTAFLGEVRRVLKEGGLVAVAAPISFCRLSEHRPASVIPVPPYHVYEFSPVTLAQLLRKAGFRVVKRLTQKDAAVEAKWYDFLYPVAKVLHLDGTMNDRMELYAVKEVKS